MKANKINERISSASPINTFMLHKSRYYFLRSCFLTTQLCLVSATQYNSQTPQRAISFVWRVVCGTES